MKVNNKFFGNFSANQNKRLVLLEGNIAKAYWCSVYVAHFRVMKNESSPQLFIENNIQKQ